MNTVNLNPLIPRLSMLQRMNMSKVETNRTKRLQESSTKTPCDSDNVDQNSINGPMNGNKVKNVSLNKINKNKLEQLNPMLFKVYTLEMP